MVPKTRKPYGIGPVGALEGLGHEFGAQVRGGGPAEDAAGVQVHGKRHTQHPPLVSLTTDLADTYRNCHRSSL